MYVTVNTKPPIVYVYIYIPVNITPTMKMASPWNAGETKRGEFLPHLALQAPLHSTQGEVLYEGLSSYN